VTHYNFDKEGDFECENVDIVIVGGGIVGSFIGHRLSQMSNKKVIILEAGSEKPSADYDWLQVEPNESKYRGAVHGRTIGLGGTSSKWGGALIPVSESELLSDLWPPEYLDLIKYSRHIEDFFNLNHKPYENRNQSELFPAYSKRVVKFPSFRNRNVFQLIRKELIRNNDFKYVLNARVTQFNFCRDLVSSVVISSPSGHSRLIRAEKFIVTTGALESTRMLLDIYAKNQTVFEGKKLPQIRSLVDHVSIPIGELIEFDFKDMSLLFGLKFNSKGMHKIKYESNLPCLNYSLDIKFAAVDKSPRELVRKIMQALQKRKPIDVKVLLNLAVNTGFILKSLLWRYLFKTFLESRNSKLIVNLTISQSTHSDNFVRLGSARDEDGIARLKIDWSVTSADTSQIFSAMKEFQSNWANSGLSKKCSFVLYDRNRVLQTISNTGGTLHPSGLIKIGTNSELDDLDLNLKVHGTRNFYCLSSGVLPTITTVNPVMTTLLLGCKLSENLLDKK